MCREPSYSTWNPVLWSPSVPDLTVRSSGRTTLCSVSRAPETIGPRAITRRAPNSWTPCWTWCAKRARTVIVCRYTKQFLKYFFNHSIIIIYYIGNRYIKIITNLLPINIFLSKNHHRSYHSISRINNPRR